MLFLMNNILFLLLKCCKSLCKNECNFSFNNCSAAGISAGAQFKESKFSLGSQISLACSLAVGSSSINLHLTVIKLTINLSYSLLKFK